MKLTKAQILEQYACPTHQEELHGDCDDCVVAVLRLAADKVEIAAKNGNSHSLNHNPQSYPANSGASSDGGGEQEK